MNSALMGKILILSGCAIIFLGIMLFFFDKIPLLGKLPGDFVIKKRNITVYFPLATMFLLSIALSAIFYLVNHFRK